MAIGASIEGFNSPVICVDATHLKARTRGVLLVAVCKDGNGMIYPLAFGFANSECIKSWTWFLKKLRKGIQNPDRVMLVSDRYNGIFNAIEAIFPDAAHGIYVYHLAQNLKRFCKQRDDVIWLYYCAAYAYRIEDFDRFMGELKETCPKPTFHCNQTNSSVHHNNKNLELSFITAGSSQQPNQLSDDHQTLTMETQSLDLDNGEPVMGLHETQMEIHLDVR
ncbi:hypothetical protein LWI29_013389 [Acer saccharum]|uniref:MULE transposase domain-containing protein n=1 Tax=Acer saccharum TaxID=4024 RepID=A0AA39TBN8_ACESA|nr:hypothetical protein LWI29_013389 [Acer saccharum]